MNTIRVLLAEDHTIVRKGLLSLLDSEPEIQVVGEAENGAQAVKKVEQLRPDVVLMDITMPVLNGLEATRQIKKRFPEVKILILTMHTTEEYIYQILQAGASGYIIKETAPEELILAIKTIHEGKSYLSPVISRKVIDEYVRQSEETDGKNSYDGLTEREREVLQLIAEGRSTGEIAELLHISVKTVETHRAHLKEKLDIHTTAELTQYAMRKGVIRSD